MMTGFMFIGAGNLSETLRTCDKCRKVVEGSVFCGAAPQQPAAPSGEAVAWVTRGSKRAHVRWFGAHEQSIPHGTKLYAAPQQPAAVGVTKRELFTIVAMHTLAAGGYAKWEHLAHDAVSLADAILAALSQQPAACVGCEGKPTPENSPCAVCGQQPAGVDRDEVRRVAQHIGTAAAYIDKAYPDAKMLDRDSTLRALRRWHERLTAALAAQQQGGA